MFKLIVFGTKFISVIQKARARDGESRLSGEFYIFFPPKTWEQEHDSGINTNVQFDKNLFSRGRQAGTQHE